MSAPRIVDAPSVLRAEGVSKRFDQALCLGQVFVLANSGQAFERRLRLGAQFFLRQFIHGPRLAASLRQAH